VATALLMILRRVVQAVVVVILVIGTLHLLALRDIRLALHIVVALLVNLVTSIPALTACHNDRLAK
jgi:hypothetical protein